LKKIRRDEVKEKVRMSEENEAIVRQYIE